LTNDLRTGTTGRENPPQPRLPLQDRLFLVLSNPLRLPPLLASLAAKALLIIILAKSFHNLTVGGKTCAILYLVPLRLTRGLSVALCGYFLSPVYEYVLSIAIVAAFALAQGIPSGLSRMEIAFVVLALVAKVGKATVTLIMSIMYSRIYKEWLLTYTMKSADDSKERFRAPWNRRITGLLETIEGL
jgi:hypothetical protein